MTAFAALRALGWTGSRALALPPGRMADPLGAAITSELEAAKLWRMDIGIGIIGDGRAVTLRVFLPEHQQSDRNLGADQAALVRAVVSATLRDLGYLVRFTDALFCEKGTKGWVVLAKAVRSVS